MHLSPPLRTKHNRYRLLSKLVNGVLALCLALTSMLVVYQPAHARYLAWPEQNPGGDFGPNEAIYIDVGAISYIRGCPDGIDDFLVPFADIYIMPFEPQLGQALYDIGGEPNPTQGTTLGGAFVSQLIGVTAPEGGIPGGVYTIVYDECQDGVLGPEDSVFPATLRVNITADPPPLPDYINEVKNSAREQATRLGIATGLIKTAGEILDSRKIRKAIEARFGTTARVVNRVTRIGGRATGVDPIDEGIANMLNGVGQFDAIADDPPDPNYQQPTLLPPVEYDPITSSQPIEQAVAVYGRLAAEEAAIAEALLHALERYQGAEQDDSGEWALVQARAVRLYALLLADHLLLMQASVDNLSSTIGTQTEDFDATALETWRQAVVDNGFRREERQLLNNFNVLSRDVVALRTMLAEEPFVSYSTGETQQALAQLKAAQGGQRTTMLEMAAQMETLINDLAALPAVVDTQPTAGAGGPYSAAISQTITLDGSGSQVAEGRTGVYAWDTDSDGQFDDAAGQKPGVAMGRAFAGYVGLLVTDSSGRQSVDYARITITGGNRAPQIANPMPADGAAVAERGVNDSIVFQAEVTDPDGDMVEYAWLLDGTSVQNSPSYSFSPAVRHLGLHELQLVVNDGKPGGVSVHRWHVVGLDYDRDTDGWRANADCHDSDANIHPGMSEVVGNGIDDDCNLRTTDTGLVLPPDLFEVTKLADTDDGLCDDDCSLREAVLAANVSLEQAVTISLKSGVYLLTIQGAEEDAGATGDLDMRPAPGQTFTLAGQGPEATVIDAEGLGDRILTVHSGSVVVEKLTLRNGSNPGHNSVNGYGGAIFVRSSAPDWNAIWNWDYIAPAVPPRSTELTVADAVLMNNKTQGTGGAIGADSGRAQVTVIRSRILNNQAVVGGGGIYGSGYGQVITLMDSEVASNSSGCYGGGVAIVSCQSFALDTLVLTNTFIVSNTVAGDITSICRDASGGGIRIAGSLTADNSVVSHNIAEADQGNSNANASGGGIVQFSCSNGAYLKLTDSVVNYNIVKAEANGHGGGILSASIPVVAERSMISGNRVEAKGTSSTGGISGPVHLTNTVVSHNYAESTGGLNLHGSSTSTIIHSTIHNNSDRGLSLNASDVFVKNSIFAHNAEGNCDDGNLGHFLSQGYNLFDDDTCPLTATGDMSNTNPLLAVETVHSIEQTTHALTPQSPTIDGVNAHACPTLDVNRVERPQAADCDIGAYEYVPSSLLRFTKARYNVPATASEVTLTVERSGDSLGEITVSYGTENVTAQAGADYTEASGVLTFAGGETTKEITVALLGSTGSEERSFMIALREPTGGALLTAMNQAAVTIEENSGSLYLPLMMQ